MNFDQKQNNSENLVQNSSSLKSTINNQEASKNELQNYFDKLINLYVFLAVDKIIFSRYLSENDIPAEPDGYILPAPSKKVLKEEEGESKSVDIAHRYFAQVTNISREFAEEGDDVRSIFYCNKYIGRIVFDRNYLETEMQLVINNIFLPQLLQNEPGLKEKILEFDGDIVFEILGVDGSLQIGTSVRDLKSKMQEYVEFQSVIFIDNKYIYTKMQLRNFDHHGNDWISRANVDSSHKQYLDHLIQKTNNTQKTSNLKKSLTISIILAEQKFAADVDYYNSISQYIMEKNNSEIFDPQTAESQIYQILVSIINEVDKFVGVPKYPVNPVENMTEEEKWLETCKFLYIQWLANWIGYYYTLNRPLMDEITDQHQIVKLSYQNLIYFTKYFAGKTTEGELKELKDMDKIEKTKFLLEKVFPDGLVLAKHLENYFDGLGAEVYNQDSSAIFHLPKKESTGESEKDESGQATLSTPKPIDFIKKHYEGQVNEVYTTSEIMDKKVEIVELSIGSGANRKVLKVACQYDSTGELAAGKAYLFNQKDCTYFFTVRTSASNQAILSWSVLGNIGGEVGAEVMEAKKVIDYLLSLYLSFLDGRFNFGTEDDEINGIVLYLRTGLYSGSRETGTSLDTAEENIKLLKNIIAAINYINDHDGVEIYNVNPYRVFEVMFEMNRGSTSIMEMLFKSRMDTVKQKNIDIANPSLVVNLFLNKLKAAN